MKLSTLKIVAYSSLVLTGSLGASSCSDTTSNASTSSSSSSSTSNSSSSSGNGGMGGAETGGNGGTGGMAGMAGMAGMGGAGGAGGAMAAVPHTLFVAHEGAFAAYDLATGNQVGTTITNSMGPKSMQALADGNIMTNMQTSNDVMVYDGIKSVELPRIAASSLGGTRPNDSYINTDLGNGRYWLLLNDGNAAMSTTWSASLIDITEGSPTRFQKLSEVPLGNGHHAAAFSGKKPRFVASSFNDCDNVFSVFDFSDPKALTKLRTITAMELGFDGSTMQKTCDPTLAAGISLKPHGCSTSKANGKTYCNMAGAGLIAIIDIDADPPTFTTLQLKGTGGGYVKAGEGGTYIYTLQATPSEATGGADCQIGQLVTIDAATDKVVHELPLLYKGVGCTDKLTGTDEAAVGPNHLRLTDDGKTLFVALSSPSSDPMSRVRWHIGVDLSNPAMPVQTKGIPVGQSTNQRGSAISGDGKILYVADSVDGTVTAIDVKTLNVVKTYTVMANPWQVATFGSVEGPSQPVGPVH